MRIRLIPHLLSLFVPIVTAHLSLDMLLAGGHFYLFASPFVLARRGTWCGN